MCFLYDTDGIPYLTKDPDAVLDYKTDWAPLTNGRIGAVSDWLASGETISSTTITEETGITVDSDSITDSGTSVTVWLSGGTAGAEYDIGVRIVTSDSRTDERTFRVKVVDR